MVLPCACHPGRPVGKPGREADRRLGRRSPAGSKTAAPAGAFVRAGSIRPLKTGRAAGGRRECPAAYEGIFFFHEKNIPSCSPGRTAGRGGAVAGFASPGAAFDAFPLALPRLPPPWNGARERNACARPSGGCGQRKGAAAVKIPGAIVPKEWWTPRRLRWRGSPGPPRQEAAALPLGSVPGDGWGRLRGNGGIRIAAPLLSPE